MSKNLGKWKTISTKNVHENPFFVVTHDEVIRPDGSEGTYNVVKTKGAVFIVPIDDENNVFLEGLNRYTTDVYSYEIPAGGTDGEEPLHAAKRELQEETGLKATTWRKLGTLNPANGMVSEDNHVFLATGVYQTGTHAQEEEGIMEVIKVPFDDVLKMIKDGKISDSQTVSAMMLAVLELDRIK